MKRTILYLLSLGVTAGSILFFGDTLRLVARWRVDGMDGIFLLQTALLAAAFFAYKAREAGDSRTITIFGSAEQR